MTSNEPDRQAERDEAAAQRESVARRLLDQQEANEKLVRAIIRAQELADSAEAAQVRAELRLQQQRETEEELRATAELRERLLGMVGHDLRNPLGAVAMTVQFLLLQGSLDAESSRLLVLCQQSLHRMDRLIRQLFEFTQIRVGGGVSLTLDRIDARSACRSAVEELKLCSAVPIEEEFRGDTSGTWDGERLIEVFSNLIGNAIEHAAPQTSVLVRLCGGVDEVISTVVNRGRPIPSELLPVLFVPFHRGLSGFKARPGHLGLGLYISHEIIRSHGGTLTVHSAEGVTTFTMRLPRSLPPT